MHLRRLEEEQQRLNACWQRAVNRSLPAEHQFERGEHGGNSIN